MDADIIEENNLTHTK